MVIEQLENFAVANPKVFIIIIGAVISLVSSLLMRHFTDQEHIRALKNRSKDLRKELQECQKKGDTCRFGKLQKEMTDISMQLMKSSFSLKYMAFTIIPFGLLFFWIRQVIAPVLSSWFWWYFLATIIWGSIIRKVLKMA
jgi:uncharacterized membrane protein (DUF106 family)